MSRFFLALLLMVATAGAATTNREYIATITFTNAVRGTTNGDTITINSSTRTYTNNVSGSPGTRIGATNSIGFSLTNTLVQLSTFSVVGVDHVRRFNAASMELYSVFDVPLTVTFSSGVGTVSYVTNVYTGMTPVRVPIAGEIVPGQRTNIASLLVTGIDAYSTNAFAEIAVALSNFVNRSQSQTFGNKTMTNVVIDGGVITNCTIAGLMIDLNGGTLSGMTLTNLVSTHGTNRFLYGGLLTNNYLSASLISNAIWVSGTITNATLVGTVSGGRLSANDVTNATAISGFVQWFGNGIWTNAHVTASVVSNSTLINDLVTSPVFNGVAAVTNTGAWITRPKVYSTLAAGNNVGITATNHYVIFSGGLSGSATIVGMASGYDGQDVVHLNKESYQITYTQNTSDPTAENRLLTLNGSDVIVTPGGFAWLKYDGTSARWRVLGGLGGSGGSATNAVGTLNGLATNLNVYATSATETNLALHGAWSQMLLVADNGSNTVASIGVDNAGHGDFFIKDATGSGATRLRGNSTSAVSFVTGYRVGLQTNSPQYGLHLVNPYMENPVVNSTGTNIAGMVNFGNQTFPNLSTNFLTYIDANGNLNVAGVTFTNIATLALLMEQAQPVAATNAIDVSAHRSQYVTLSNNLAYAFINTNRGSLALTYYNDGLGTYTVNHPAATHLDSGALPTSLAAGEFFTVLWRWQAGFVHAGVIANSTTTIVIPSGASATNLTVRGLTMPQLTAGRVVVTDGASNITNSVGVTSTELNWLDGIAGSAASGVLGFQSSSKLVALADGHLTTSNAANTAATSWTVNTVTNLGDSWITWIDEQWFPASYGISNASSTTYAWGGGATFQTLEFTSPTNRMLDTYVFSDATTNAVQFMWRSPRNWNAGTVRAMLTWTTTNGIANQTNVWSVAGSAISHDDPIATQDWGTSQTAISPVTAANDLIESPATSAITIAGTPVAGDWVWFLVRRLGSDANDAMSSGQSRLIGLTIQYTRNRIGVTAWP